MEIDFEKLGGLVPAIIQDAVTKNVLMLGFMNQEAYDKTIATKKVTFWSRSRNCLWTKGETSGNFLNLVSIQNDCDNDTLLVGIEIVFVERCAIRKNVFCLGNGLLAEWHIITMYEIGVGMKQRISGRLV
jgi:phosphoribosyl-AMP cyclohydrolase